jgi:hypothetical protein
MLRAEQRAREASEAAQLSQRAFEDCRSDLEDERKRLDGETRQLRETSAREERLKAEKSGLEVEVRKAREFAAEFERLRSSIQGKWIVTPPARLEDQAASQPARKWTRLLDPATERGRLYVRTIGDCPAQADKEGLVEGIKAELVRGKAPIGDRDADGIVCAELRILQPTDGEGDRVVQLLLYVLAQEVHLGSARDGRAEAQRAWIANAPICVRTGLLRGDGGRNPDPCSDVADEIRRLVESATEELLKGVTPATGAAPDAGEKSR